ncbi:type II secretion system F family protein, partial [Clostridium perfringens]
SIGDSLKTVEELPSLLLSMITIGEESGKLDTVLNTVTEYYENELDSKLEIGTKYFENFITLFIGVMVGIIVISMMVPMFDAVSAI